MSATDSICFVVLLAPWPDLVSIRIRRGRSPPAFSCSVAAY